MEKRFYNSDPWLDPYRGVIEKRIAAFREREVLLCGGSTLVDFANGHNWYGLHYVDGGWVMREHAPNARAIYLVGPFTLWKKDERFRFSPDKAGNWTLNIDSKVIAHGDLYKLSVEW